MTEEWNRRQVDSPLRRVLADRPWQGGRVARGAESWLPATWLGSAWIMVRMTLCIMVKLIFTLGKGEGGVLEGRLGASCKEIVSKKLLEIFSNFTFYVQLCSMHSAFIFAELTSNSSCFF